MRSDVFNRHMKRVNHIQNEKEPDLQLDNSMKMDDDISVERNKETLSQSDEDRDDIGRYAWKNNKVTRNPHFLFPRNIRAIVCGKSGVGKTCLVTYLLLEPNTLDFNNLIICGKSLHQPEYKIMKAAFSRGWSKNQVNKLFEFQDEIDEVDKVTRESVKVE